MPRRSRVDRRGSVLRGAGMTLSGPERSPRRNLTLREAGVVPKDQKSADGFLMAAWEGMSEAEFQAHVEYGLRQRGFLYWHVRDARLMAAGLPDVIAAREGQLVFLELKR